MEKKGLLQISGTRLLHFRWAAKVLPLLIAFMFPVTVQAAQFGDFGYAVTNGSVTITSYTGVDGSITIPDLIESLPVTSIGSGAFYNRTNLTSVTIPYGITNIGVSAFSLCSQLASITIPGSVITVGDSAFSSSGLTSVTIGAGTVSLGSYSFQSCSRLTDVAIPSSVITVGDYAFQYCSGLVGITVQSNVTNIGSFAFDSCTSLTNVTIPASVALIGSRAFSSCSKLAAITVDANNPFYSSLDGFLFDKGRTTLIQCPGGRAGGYTVPSGVTHIGNYAFAWCSSLTNVVIPDSVVSLGNYAFYVCSGLSRVSVGSGVTNIGSYAFQYNLSLKDAYFRGNAPAIGSMVFYYARNATVYCLPGTAGWGGALEICPVVLWNPQIQTGNTGFGIRSNRFEFVVTATNNFDVAVETCTNLNSGSWARLQIGTLSNGSLSFSDPLFTNYPGCFYRLRMP